MVWFGLITISGYSLRSCKLQDANCKADPFHETNDT